MVDSLEHACSLAQVFLAGEPVDFEPKSVWEEHVKQALAYLMTKEAKALLKRFTLPVTSRFVEDLIRTTLSLSPFKRIEKIDVQQAVVSALLYPLRQIIGSCFATAPAIYIQREQPECLLLDLFDLMMTGTLKRTFGGEAYVVPMSPKWGGRKEDHPLLRTWEYTLASFSDYKTMFSSWNLYQSLGLDPKISGGIGSLIYQTLQVKLDDANKEVEKLHEDYLRAVDEARVSQAFLRRADTEDRIRLRKGELDARAHHAYVTKEICDEAHERAGGLAQFFPFLIEQYAALFEEYFLEVYDADIEHVKEVLYEDSPAGFRLCYKHGRKDPSAWTLIHNEEEFFTSLRQFFLGVEVEVSHRCEWEGGEKEIRSLTTAIVHYIDTEEFRAFALKEKKPWSYTSGGNMHTLLKGYYCIEGTLSEEKRSIESPTDLLIFLLDTMKSLPYTVTKPFEIDPLASLLMYSPTHAFLLKPGLPTFKKGWLDKGFTYTWVRDYIIDPGKKALAGVCLDQGKQTLLGKHLFGDAFSPHRESLNLPEFRHYLYEMGRDKEEAIDALLYHTFHKEDPLVFADTNWGDFLFAFAINPATLELDLYRVTSNLRVGFPMNPWRSYLDGTSTAPWGVLTRPSDLTGTGLSDIALKLKKI